MLRFGQFWIWTTSAKTTRYSAGFASGCGSCHSSMPLIMSLVCVLYTVCMQLCVTALVSHHWRVCNAVVLLIVLLRVVHHQALDLFLRHHHFHSSHHLLCLRLTSRPSDRRFQASMPATLPTRSTPCLPSIPVCLHLHLLEDFIHLWCPRLWWWVLRTSSAARMLCSVQLQVSSVCVYCCSCLLYTSPSPRD